MKRRILCVGAITFASTAAFSATVQFTVASDTLSPYSATANTGTILNFSASGTTPARAIYMSDGKWFGSTGTAYSNEFRVGLKNTTTGVSVLGSNSFTGTSSSADFNFVNPTSGATWNNVSLTNAGLLGFTSPTFNLNGNIEVSFRQTFSASSGKVSAGSKLNVMTDVWSATGDVSTSSTTFKRPASLTTQGSGTAYKYVAHNFTVATSGMYLVGMNGSTAWDTHLELYAGGFSAGTPLVNLIGSDDDQATIASSTGTQSSAMMMNLTAGTQYTLVATHYAATAPTSAPYTVYVAGGAVVPEPATFLALGIGMAVLIRRKRSR